ncbi:hypothetical protein [Alkalicoccobacillus porphyridii]|uniref:Flagellar hook-length control protein FliK n=1 Tax=Alkalicoccobacillus porphyridii TaxID=2597270 RepID=A0A553ZY69_9BACI|nr:hypothetical protein [Alkalicoccobacillus porphyridii]TSB46393.1 hypothetical protein FN960_11340 [Alkalicoccobacillus porphyridii]
MVDIQSLRTNIKHANAQKPVLSLQTGQLITGKVLKHFPDQLASISIRGMTVMAKLETPVAAGSSYWFLVQQGNMLPTLKIMQPDSDNALLKTDDFAQGKWTSSNEAAMLLRSMRESAIPFTSKQLEEGVSLLKQFGSKELPIIGRMIQEQLPLTPSVLQAIRSIDGTEGLSKTLSTLIQAQNRNGEGEALHSIQNLLQRAQGPDVSSPINEVLRIIIDSTSDQELKQAAVRILSRLGWPDITNTTQPDELMEQWRARSGPSLTPDFKQLLLHTNDQRTLMERWPSVVTQQLLPKEREVMQAAIKHSVSDTVLSEGKPIPFAKQLQQIIQLTGYQHEADITAGKQSTSTLKAALGQLLSEAASPEVRALAESALHKITGYQIQSLQSDSLVHLVAQFPLKLGEYQTDMTLQYQGKKKEDGNVDPNHCKLLFFLTLEHLRETMVEVTIQQRIAHVSITTNQEKPVMLMSLLEPVLKASLHKADYQLSTISWTMWSDNKKMTRSPQPSTQMDYQGLDIRI